MAARLFMTRHEEGLGALVAGTTAAVAMEVDEGRHCRRRAGIHHRQQVDMVGNAVEIALLLVPNSIP